MYSLGFSTCGIILSMNKCRYTSLFQAWMHFISLYCPVVLARTSNTRLTRSGESGKPCLVPDLSGKFLSLWPLIMMLFAVFLQMSFIMMRKFSPFPSFLSVLTMKRWLLPKMPVRWQYLLLLNFCHNGTFVIYNDFCPYIPLLPFLPLIFEPAN